ncbi:MAG: hypothetical protein WCO71_13580, partial [Pseudomonadota bacterium]
GLEFKLGGELFQNVDHVLHFESVLSIYCHLYSAETRGRPSWSARWGSEKTDSIQVIISS